MVVVLVAVIVGCGCGVRWAAFCNYVSVEGCAPMRNTLSGEGCKVYVSVVVGFSEVETSWATQ